MTGNERTLERKYWTAAIVAAAGLALAGLDLALGPYFRLSAIDLEGELFYNSPASYWRLQFMLVALVVAFPVLTISVSRLVAKDFAFRDAAAMSRDWRTWRTPAAVWIAVLPVVAEVLHWVNAFTDSWTSSSIDYYEGWALAAHAPWLLLLPILAAAIIQRLRYGPPPKRVSRRERRAAAAAEKAA